MNYRQLGRLEWQISEIGHGMWGMAGWSGGDEAQAVSALERSLELGCNFFDTAWAYGAGKSERMLGALLQRRGSKQLLAATKIPPKNLRWTDLAGVPLKDVFPPDHIREYTYRSLENLRVSTLDLQQFHAWNDEWSGDPSWQEAVSELKAEGVVRAFGISVNRWEPRNVVRALETDLVDVVQVVYNIFDQAPEDVLFHVCEERRIGIIARVPFDEGSLTGTLTSTSTWPEGDFRNIYFTPDHLAEALSRVDRLRSLPRADYDLPTLALRFILSHRAVSTTIPGMRHPSHVEHNVRASDAGPLPPELVHALKSHRWDRSFVLP